MSGGDGLQISATEPEAAGQRLNFFQQPSFNHSPKGRAADATCKFVALSEAVAIRGGGDSKITRLSTMKVHPRLAMELARHSDMRLTMKTYTDAGQPPLREVMDTLPGFGSDSRIDSRNLGAAGQTVSRPVPDAREIKTDSGIENKVLLAGHVELLHDAVHGIVPTPV